MRIQGPCTLFAINALVRVDFHCCVNFTSVTHVDYFTRVNKMQKIV